jgi:hypothetical protein
MGFQTVPPSTAPSTPDMSLLQRIWGILVSPRAVLESIRDRPRLQGVLIVLAVVYLIVGVLLTRPSVNDQMDQIAKQGANMTAEQLEQAQSRTESIMPFAVPASAVAFGLAALFVVAAVLMLLANVVLGGSVKFKAMAAAIAHTSMVGIPASLVKVPLSIAKGTNKVQTSLAALLPSDAEETVLYRVLAQFDVFALWMLGLNILAVAIVARIPTRKAAVAMVVLWLVWSAAVVALQSVFAGLGNR